MGNSTWFPAAFLVVLITVSLWLLTAGGRTAERPRFQFGLRDLFRWTTIAALCMFVASQSLTAGLFVLYAIGLAYVLRFCEQTASFAAALLLLFYMSVGMLLFIYLALSLEGAWFGLPRF